MVKAAKYAPDMQPKVELRRGNPVLAAITSAQLGMVNTHGLGATATRAGRSTCAYDTTRDTTGCVCRGCDWL
jgi:hypothetical protein